MTEEERTLWDQIRDYWDKEYGIDGHTGKWESDGIGAKQRALTNSLIRRKAIPAHRLAWLKDPGRIVGMKKSRWQNFCDNYGASDDRVFSHPHWYFAGILPFLIGVINLPEHIVREFRKDAEDKMNDAYDMGIKYRAAASAAGLTKAAAGEFQKLACDCGYEVDVCRSIRDIIYKHLKKYG